MIPALALFIGAYVITRMVELIRDETLRNPGATAPAVLALLTIVLTVICVGYIVYQGVAVADAFANPRLR